MDTAIHFLIVERTTARRRKYRELGKDVSLLGIELAIQHGNDFLGAPILGGPLPACRHHFDRIAGTPGW